jgi:hypothetical protein
MAATPKPVRKAKKGLELQSKELHAKGRGFFRHMTKAAHQKHVKKMLRKSTMYDK